MSSQTYVHTLIYSLVTPPWVCFLRTGRSWSITWNCITVNAVKITTPWDDDGLGESTASKSGAPVLPSSSGSDVKAQTPIAEPQDQDDYNAPMVFWPTDHAAADSWYAEMPSEHPNYILQGSGIQSLPSFPAYAEMPPEHPDNILKGSGDQTLPSFPAYTETLIP